MNTLITLANTWGQRWLDFALPMLLQSSLLILVLLALDRLLRNKVRAVVRYGLWMLLPLKLVLPVSFSLPTGVGYWVGATATHPVESKVVPGQPLPSLARPAPPSVPGDALLLIFRSQPEFKPLSPSLIKPTPARLAWPALLWLGWMVGGLTLLGMILNRSFWVRRLVRQASDAPPAWSEMLQRCLRQLKLSRQVRLKISRQAVGPAVCGLWRPTIVIPAQLAGQSSATSIRAVLLHELAHLKRHDLWVNHLQSLLQLIYFYNPLLWQANAAIRRVREQAVDEMVLVALGNESIHYPETLLAVAKLALNRSNPALGLVGIVENKHSLTQRLKLMIDRPIPRSTRLGLAGLLLVALTGALFLPMARGQRDEASTPRPIFEPADTLKGLPTAEVPAPERALPPTNTLSLLAQLRPDDPTSTNTYAANNLEVRVFRLAHADAVEIAKVFQNLFPGPTGSNGNRTATPPKIQTGSDSVAPARKLDDGKETNLARLKNQRGKVVVVPDPRTNVIIVSAPHELMPKITEMVAQFDTAERKPRRVIYNLRGAGNDAIAVQKVLESMFSDQRPSWVKDQYYSMPSPIVNLWAIDQGITIVNHSPLFPDFSIQDMFGAAQSRRESGTTVFADEGGPNFVHFVEWRTEKPVTIRSLNLFAAGDGLEYYHEREFAAFTLKAKSPGSAEYDKTLISYQPTHPYEYFDAQKLLLIRTNIAPVTAREFRAEFKQYNAGRGYDGPRILELAAFSTLVPPRESSRTRPRIEPPIQQVNVTNLPGYEIINIDVSPRDEYQLAGQPIKLDQLENALAKAIDAKVNVIVYIRADQTAKMEAVKAVMDLCQKRHITQIVIRLASDK